MKHFLTWVYALRSCIFISVALVSLIVFLYGRKKRGKAFRAVTLGLVGINVLLIAIGSCNAFLRPQYQQQPITRSELETLCAKLADGSYDPEQFLPNCENEDPDPHGRDREQQGDIQRPKSFYRKFVHLPSGWLSRLTEMDSDLYIDAYEFDTEKQAQLFYQDCMQEYWDGTTFLGTGERGENRDQILQRGYLEIENADYQAYITPVEYAADYFNPEQGDYVRKQMEILVQYGCFVVSFREDSSTNKTLLPDLVKNQLLFDPAYTPEEG